MYIPTHFEISDKEEIFSFIEANAFGQLISTLDGKLFSTHIPFLLTEDKSALLCHVALQNPQHKNIEGQEVLVTLEGPHDYISPSWYGSPGVPTWNFQAVHIYGQCKIFRDADRLKNVVDSLTSKYESGFQEPWRPDYNASMLKAIVGIEIAINDVQCKYKLSQNRSSEDRSQVIENLRALGSNSLAEAMERNRR